LKKKKIHLFKVQRLAYVPPELTQNLCIFSTRCICLHYESHNKTVSAKRAEHVTLTYVNFLGRKEQCCPPKCWYGHWKWK